MTIDFNDLKNPKYADLVLGDAERGLKVSKKRLTLAVSVIFQHCPTPGCRVELLHTCVTIGRTEKCICGSTNLLRRTGERNGRCLDCRRDFSFTAITEFYKGLKQVDAWAVYLTLKELGYCFSSAMFASVMGISTSTARAINLKTNSAVLCTLQQEVDVLLVSSAQLIDTYSRRSILTPAKEHPSVEQKLMEDLKENGQNNGSKEDNNQKENDQRDNNQKKQQKKDQDKQQSQSHSQSSTKSGAEDFDFRTDDETETGNSATEQIRQISSAKNSEAPADAKLTDSQHAILAALEDKPIGFGTLYQKVDGSISKLLSDLTILELGGFVNQWAGDCYSLVLKSNTKPPQAQPEHDSEFLKGQVQWTINHILNVHGGVARKYVELYSADAYRAQCQQQGRQGFSVLVACRDIENVDNFNLRFFNSPLNIALTTSTQMAA